MLIYAYVCILMSADIILILKQFGTHSESERKTEKYDAQVSSWELHATIKYWLLL